MSRRTVGYVGLNHHHARPYLESLETLPVTVTAACEPDRTVDPDLETYPGLAAADLYRDPVELLETAAPDAIWVTLSNRDAPDVIEAAVERDVDVFTEKPVARTAADLESVVPAADASESTVCVSTPWRAHPAAKELKQRAENTFFGDLRTVETRFFASKIAHRDAEHYLYDRAASRGGIVQWLGVHWIDLLEWVLEEPIARVNASASSRSPAIDVEDGAVVQFEFESGGHGTLQCGYYLLEGRYDTAVSITGTDGRAVWDPMGETFDFETENTLHLEAPEFEDDGSPRQSITYEYDDVPGYGGEFGRSFMEAFLAACEDDRSPPTTLSETVRRLHVLDAIYESADAGGWTSV